MDGASPGRQARPDRGDPGRARPGRLDRPARADRLARAWRSTILWHGAIEKQKRNEWNDLEFIVRSLTKLQPHFLTPWLFQSWNLSYNVSVESDRVKDKYFYISRGIELLAQGERLNKDNPDMRYWIGFYYQNKFGVSDENSTLRSLFQIQLHSAGTAKPGPDRPEGPADPAGGKSTRRSSRSSAGSIRSWSADSGSRPRNCPAVPCATRPTRWSNSSRTTAQLPSRFVDADEERGQLLAGRPGDLKPADQQFPTLPPAKPNGIDSNDSEPIASDTAGTLDDTFDAFTAARAWFSYAQDPLPDPDPLADAQDRKERMKTLKGRRLPRQPAEVLFRQAPPRAQSYVGERLA